MARGYHAVDSQYLRIKTFELNEKRSMLSYLRWEHRARAVYWVIKEAAMKLDGAPVRHDEALNCDVKLFILTQ